MRISCRVTATPSPSSYICSTLRSLPSLPFSLLIVAGGTSLSFPSALLASLSPLLSSFLSPSSYLLLPSQLANSLPLLSTLLTTGSCRGSRTRLEGLQEVLQCLGLQGRVGTVLEGVESSSNPLEEVQSPLEGVESSSSTSSSSTSSSSILNYKHRPWEVVVQAGSAAQSQKVERNQEVEKEKHKKVTPQKITTPQKCMPLILRKEGTHRKKVKVQKLLPPQVERVLSPVRVAHALPKGKMKGNFMNFMLAKLPMPKDGEIGQEKELPQAMEEEDPANVTREQVEVQENVTAGPEEVKVPEDEQATGLDMLSCDSIVEEDLIEQSQSDVNYNNTIEEKVQANIFGTNKLSGDSAVLKVENNVLESRLARARKTYLGSQGEDEVKQKLGTKNMSKKFKPSMSKNTKKLNEIKEKDKIFSCDLCSYDTIRKGAFSKHMKITHQVNTIVSWLSCEECDYKTKNPGHLMRHKGAKHEGVKFPCQHCDLQFSVQESLKHHIQNLHEGTKFPCPHCEHQATRAYDLKYHIEWKHSNLKFFCDLCEHESNTEKKLRIHKRTIHECLWYVCEEPGCDYRAVDTSTLTSHIKVTHEGLRVSCELCDKVYTKISTLNNHIRCKHPNTPKV